MDPAYAAPPVSLAHSLGAGSIALGPVPGQPAALAATADRAAGACRRARRLPGAQPRPATGGQPARSGRWPAPHRTAVESPRAHAEGRMGTRQPLRPRALQGLPGDPMARRRSRDALDRTPAG